MRRIATAAQDGSAYLDDLDGHAFPSRPSVPAVAALSFSLWASCALCLSLMIGKPLTVAAIAIALGVAVALLALAVAWRLSSWALLALAIAGLALGFSLGCAHLVSWQAQMDSADGQGGLWSCRAVGDGEQGDFGQNVYADVSGDEVTCRVRVFLPEGASQVRYGDRFLVHGSIARPKDSQLGMYLQRDACGSLKAVDWESSDALSVADLLCAIRNSTIDFLKPFSVRDGGVTAALVCAWRGDLDEELYRSFQVCGLAHIVAVSGAHLSLVAAFVGSVTRRLRVPRWLASTVQAVFILAYLIFTAMPISALRACVMTIAALSCSSFMRRSAALNALAVCVLGVVVIDPGAALSVSFALSTLSTFGIIVFGSLIACWLKTLLSRCPAFAVDAAALTLASSLTATPFSAALFSQIPLIAILANIVVAPLFAPVCAIGLAASLCARIFPGTYLVAGNACSWASWLLGDVISKLSCIPYASLPVDLSEGAALALSFLLCALLWAFWPSPRRPSVRGAAALVALAVAGAFALVAITPRGIELIMLDVGQGDAILLRSAGKTLLVDTGNQDSRLREALGRQGVRDIDAVLITHPDDDHMGSLSSLRGVVGVSNVIVARDALECPCSSCARLRADASALVGDDRIETIEVGDSLRFGSWEAACIWPHGFSDEGGNADSICLLATADVDNDGEGEGNALMVGDAEHDQLAALIDEGALPKIDIYKVGHHGSKNALTEEQAMRLSPALSLISVGAGNRYGHPAEKTLSSLKDCGSTVFRTDVSGDIVCDFTKGGIAVRTVR